MSGRPLRSGRTVRRISRLGLLVGTWSLLSLPIVACADSTPLELVFTGVVQGRVHSQGIGIPDVLVQMEAAGRGYATSTDSEGRFRADSLTVGMWTVGIQPPDGWSVIAQTPEDGVIIVGSEVVTVDFEIGPSP